MAKETAAVLVELKRTEFADELVPPDTKLGSALMRDAVPPQSSVVSGMTIRSPPTRFNVACLSITRTLAVVAVSEAMVQLVVKVCVLPHWLPDNPDVSWT